MGIAVVDASKLDISQDPTAAATRCADLIAFAIREAVQLRGIARIAISGGNTPSPVYRDLSTRELPWGQTEWFWVDERAVPKDSDRSNFGKAEKELGLIKNGVPEAMIHPMPADATDRQLAARQYEATIRGSFGVAAEVAFDVVTLGMGEDGHTASLFPGVQLPDGRAPVAVIDRLVLALDAPDGLEPRLTLTAPVLIHARLLLILCIGANKRTIVGSARTQGSVVEVPARLTHEAKGSVVWVVDRAAAPESTAGG